MYINKKFVKNSVIINIVINMFLNILIFFTNTCIEQVYYQMRNV